MDIKHRSLEKYPQKKAKGSVVTTNGNIELIVFDHFTNSYRLVGLDDGVVYSERYDTLDQLFKENGDSELVVSAELIVQEY
jgi:hypothetical protein